MENRLQINDSVSIPLSEIELKTSRSSGPGGQHANVTASRVEAVFVVAESKALADGQKRLISARLGPVVRATSQEHRSQARNRELALERLGERLAKALRVQRRRVKTKPSRAARRRRIEGKRRNAQRKQLRRRPSGDD